MIRTLTIALLLATSVAHAADNPRRLPTPTMSRSDCDRLLWAMVDIDDQLRGMSCGGLYVSKCLTAYMWLVKERERLGLLYLGNLCHYWEP